MNTPENQQPKPTHYITGENGQQGPLEHEDAVTIEETAADFELEDKVDSESNEESAQVKEPTHAEELPTINIEQAEAEQEEESSDITEPTEESQPKQPEEDSGTKPKEDDPKVTAEEESSDQEKADVVEDNTGSNQQVQEVKSAGKIIDADSPEQPASKKKKGVTAVVAGVLLAVGLGGAFAATRGGSNESGPKNPSSTSAEANPGNSNEQESSQNILAGITVEKTLKEFDNKEYKNVMSLLEAKNFSRNPLDTPAVHLAVQVDPNHAPIADYNVKIFDTLLNGSSDEIKDLLQKLGLGPTELKKLYDKSIKLGTFNEWGDIQLNTGGGKPWPSTQGSYTEHLDVLSMSIMYNRVFAVSIANAIEVTGGDIPPAAPRDAETLRKNNELITGAMGPFENVTVAVDSKGDITVDPSTGNYVIPEKNILESTNDMMVIYIDPDDPDLKLQISEIMPSLVEKATNPGYLSTTGLPGNLTIYTKYPYEGPTTSMLFIYKKY